MRLLPVRFTLRSMMVAVAVIASALIDAKLATFVVLLIASGVAFRSLILEPVGARSRHWAVPYFVSLACLYLPFAWVVLDYPWDGYRLHWIKMWPILPGLIAGMFAHPNDSATAFIAGALAVLLVALLTRLGRASRTALVVTSLVALIGSGLESWFAYQLFLW